MLSKLSKPSKEYMNIFFDYIFWILLAYCVGRSKGTGFTAPEAVNAVIWLGEKMGRRLSAPLRRVPAVAHAARH